MQLTKQRCTVEIVDDRVRTDYVVHINIGDFPRDNQMTKYILGVFGVAERQEVYGLLIVTDAHLRR